MRIIAGKAGRVAIKVPSAVARPTTDFVRQAIFSILGDTIDHARVLDLFAGSGALGLEALSRGASSAVFVDDHRQACSVIQENLTKAKLTGARVIKSEVLSFLKRDSSQYDLIFADPPYWKNYGDKDHATAILNSELLPPRLSPTGRFVLEISSNQATPTHPHFTLLDRRQYGNTSVLLYQPTQP